MDKEQTFTSTGIKLIQHPDAIIDLRNKRNHPIVLHIMPTEVCNLKCVFCSVAQRGSENKLFPDLDLEKIKDVVYVLKNMGLKAVILSGGGDPTLYYRINDLISHLNNEKLDIGIITNGLALKRNLNQINLDMLSWVRISINTLDYREDFEIPKLNPETTLGFSYIYNQLTTDKILGNIRKKIEEQSTKNPVEYVRMLPDCNLETSELEKAHLELRELTNKLGPPFFHQYKTHNTPAECHLGRVHPVLYTDGYVYPCDSLVLNSPTENKKFNQEFALCKWNEVKNFYSQKINGSLVDTKKCPHCVFNKQNSLLADIINFENQKHINFI